MCSGVKLRCSWCKIQLVFLLHSLFGCAAARAHHDEDFVGVKRTREEGDNGGLQPAKLRHTTSAADTSMAKSSPGMFCLFWFSNLLKFQDHPLQT